MDTPAFLHRHALTLSTLLAAVAASCSGRSGGASPSLVPNLAAAKFTHSTRIDNPLLPLEAGHTHLYVSPTDDGPETVIVEVLEQTRVVQGVTCRVVRDRVFRDGLLLEDTHDWFAQDDAGNVWYFGEEVDNYEYDDEGNLLGIDHEGAWEAGHDVAGVGVVALPGYAMPASPRVGQRYHSEYYRSRAEDLAEVVALDVEVRLDDGRVFRCLQTRDTSPLSPGVEFKYYAAGIGLVAETDGQGGPKGQHVGSVVPGTASLPEFAAARFSSPTNVTNRWLPMPAGTATVRRGGEDGEIEVVVIERLPGERVVAGVACAIVRDRVFRDGLLIEDTRDWFAQDDAGNVWYMGEEVDNYEYDEQGNLLGIDHEGSWEAGRDIAGVGADARPGFAMLAAPAAGVGYHQEYYPGEAEDMGLVIATGVTIELEDGSEHTDCLQVLDWAPLDPHGIEYKFYAPGIGLIREAALHKDQLVDRAGAFALGEAALPDFAAATFANSTLVDHPALGFAAGRSWSYRKATPDGEETSLVEVLSSPRTVAGIACLVVRDRVWLDGRLLEDTQDWYAQDDAGNVWYMGEEVDNYEYDEQGNLLGINHDGAWEAGRDVGNVGHDARPGLRVPAAPAAGRSFYQEYYRTVAEDVAFVVATDATADLGDGRVYEDCLLLLDWSPLSPASLEHKYFAPGVGLVLEIDLVDGERLLPVGSTVR